MPTHRLHYLIKTGVAEGPTAKAGEATVLHECGEGPGLRTAGR